MSRKNDKSLGLLVTIIGIALLIAFSAPFMLHMIGIAAALLVINYGLKVQGLQGLVFVMGQFYQQHFNFKNRR
ncbi:MAG TPA: hypothetical protein VJJ83_04650 [Candidatus Babeliales bacterium]|nr:hypothetical protein [Candidatus Babeliales bacterium]